MVAMPKRLVRLARALAALTVTAACAHSAPMMASIDTDLHRPTVHKPIVVAYEVPPPTTITVAPQPPPKPAPTWSGTGLAAGTVKGWPCGGDLPPCCVLWRESGSSSTAAGMPTAENPVSTASGLWQFVDGTWAGYGGYSHASYAPASVQNDRARQVWAGGAGWHNWAPRCW